MRRLIPLGFLALFAALAPPAHGQDVTGEWELTTEGPRGTRTLTATFAQEGSAVTGTVVFQFMGRGGGGGGGTREVKISDGRIENGTLTFTMAMGMGQRSFSQTFTGTVTGDSMEGTVTTPRGENPFTGKRKEG
jgi:hypothetical protein